MVKNASLFQASEVRGKMSLQSGSWHRAALMALVVGIALPPIYLLVMVQYGARLFPYWDHMATAKQIVEYFDGTLTLRSLIEPQSQARPLFPRLIFLGNAALTNWDIRSEYIYIYLTVYGTLAALLLTLWRLSKGWPSSITLMASLCISIIACSPVGAMNYYWSLMLIATLSYFCSIAAFLIVSVSPASRGANVVAAILAWIATYSISQGLLVFPTVIIAHQLIAPRMLVPTRWSLFWIANAAACYAIYFPGLTNDLPFPAPPRLYDFVAFVVVYLGNPLGSLLWFPNLGAILIPSEIIINAACGVLLLGVGVLILVRVWHEARAWREKAVSCPETLVFITLAVFAVACAMITAWGRANGPEPIAVANSSRYSMFAATLLFGLIFFFASRFARRDLPPAGWLKTGIAIFCAASAVSYARAVPVFTATHDDNDWLAAVYDPHRQPTDLDRQVYPDKLYFDNYRSDLLRLRIGPYRSLPQASEPIYTGPFAAAIPLTNGTAVSQRFTLAYPILRSVSVQIVTFGKWPSSYRIQWEVVGFKQGNQLSLGEGEFSTLGLADWQTKRFPMKKMIEVDEAEVRFSVQGGEGVKTPIGLPLFSPGTAPLSPALINGIARDDGSKIGLRVNSGE
jgi:hypothetical protein